MGLLVDGKHGQGQGMPEKIETFAMTLINPNNVSLTTAKFSRRREWWMLVAHLQSPSSHP
jgi:hypothetical protein